MPRPARPVRIIEVMELVQFHAVRAGIQGHAVPGSPLDAEAVGAALRQALLGSGLFLDVEVGTTADRDRLVAARCRSAPEYAEDDLVRHLENLWHEAVRYPFWEAHAFGVTDGLVTFEAATRDGAAGPYVTVDLLVFAARIPAQRRPSD